MSKISYPMSIAPILKGLGEQFGLEKGLVLFRLQERWKEAVGPQIASHTHPVEIRFDTLVLLVDSAAWMQELSFFKKALIQKSNAFLGGGPIQRLQLKIGPLPPPNLAPVANQIAATEECTGECTADERLLIDEQLLPISDPGLKEAIRKAMRRRLVS